MQEHQDIVTFADDKAILPEHTPGEQVLSGPQNDQHTDWMQHSIITFMSRPQLLGDYKWSTGLQRGYVVDGLDIKVPDKLLTPMILNKLDGFTSFRATAVVKLQINSQPFQCGRLIMAAIPMPDLIAPRDTFLLRHPTFLQSINHVQIDISKQTEISLRIPFVSPFNSYNLIDNKYSWARLAVVVYSPLVDISPEGGYVPLRVWAHFEDVQLGMPTSGRYGKPDGDPGVPRIRQQSGAIKEPAPKAVKLAQTVESLGATGVLKGAADAVVDGAASVWSGIGNALPFLKPVTDVFAGLAGPTKSIAGTILGWLGFSKPQIGYSGVSVLTRPCEYFGNANGIDHSHVLALDRMNNVDFYPGLGGTSLDEMSFDFLKKIPQFVSYFSYKRLTDISELGKPLFETWVMPTYFAPGYLRIKAPMYRTEPTTPNANYFKELQELQPTVLNYICSSFMYWTGSLVYTFRFIKTDFHSGRVEISFHPFTNETLESRMNYVYRLVVDLRENTEVSVSVPYISPQPWKTIAAKDPLYKGGTWDVVAGVNSSIYGDSATGKLVVRAITPLILSSTVVKPEIECVVEVRAGDDFRVQGPCRSGYFPFTPTKTPQSQIPDNQTPPDSPLCYDKDLLVWRKCSEMYPRQQSGPFALAGTSETRTASIEGLVPDSITLGAVDIHRTDTSALCAGEGFANFRSLIKRFAFVERFDKFPFKTGVLSRRVPFYLVPPKMSSLTYVSQDQTPGKVQAFAQFTMDRAITPLVFISSMYAFYRGGLRMKIYLPNKETKLVSARVLDVSDLPEGTGMVRRVASFMAPTAFELIQLKGFAEFQIPFYSPVFLCIPWDEERESLFDQSSAAVEVSFSNETVPEEDSSVYIAVAGSDDMTFHGFLGVPPVISLGRINDYYVAQDKSGPDPIPLPGSNVSYINTEPMQVDPTYPLERYTPDPSPFWTRYPFGCSSSVGDCQAPVQVSIDDIVFCPFLGGPYSWDPSACKGGTNPGPPACSDGRCVELPS